MKHLTRASALVLTVIFANAAVMLAQQDFPNSDGAVMPRLIRFAGSLTANETSARVTGVTFSLYREESGGTPLWTETQNVTLDDQGHYDVLLGSTIAKGIPMELFTSGEARWLGVRAESGRELPRILLVSVPYAAKAMDAETLGGKPATAFALANPQNNEESKAALPRATPAPTSVPPQATIMGTGSADFIARWTSATNLGSSLLYQGPNGNFGIGTTTPSAKLAVFLTAANTTAIRGTSFASSGGTGVEGVTGTTTAFPGNMAAVMGLNQSKFGIAGLFNTTSINSDILVGQYNGQQVFAVDPTGRVIGSTGLFTTQALQPAVTGYSTFNNCITINACNFGYLGGGAGVTGVGGASNPAGVFNSQGTGLILEGTSSVGDMFTVAHNGFVHTGSLLVDGINNTNIFGVQAYAFGAGAVGVYGEADTSNNIGVSGFSLHGSAVSGISQDGLAGAFGGESFVTGHGSCAIDWAGNLACSGTKSAVVPLRDGRKVALYAVEAPENWFEDFGGGTLKGGSTIVFLDPEFAQTVNLDVAYRVFVTPNGECGGLYVTNKTASSFEVRELNGGQSNVSFDYRIVARRRGYEALRMRDLTKQQEEVGAALARKAQQPRRPVASKHP